MTILGPDVSHFQGPINWPQVRASGRDFCVLKATEGTGYVDPTLTTNRRNAHAAGLVVGLYHFARAGNPAAEALYFLRTIGPLQPGEFLVLDQEIPNTVGWCQTWLDTVYHATGVRPLVYMNQSPNTGLYLGNWSGVAANYGLWLAKYDQSTAQPAVPYWGAPAMKQFYDKGVVPGIAGPCDVDVFYGTRDQLLAYGKGGTPPTPPPPTVHQEDDMRLVRNKDTGGVYLVSEFDVQTMDPASWDAQTAAGYQNSEVTGAQFDIIFKQATARRGALMQDVQNYILGSDPGTDPQQWLFNRIVAIGDTVKALQSGGVDPAEVATLVLTGIKAQMSADVPPPAAS